MAKIVFLEDDDLTLSVFQRFLVKLAEDGAPTHDFIEVYSEEEFRRRLSSNQLDKADLFVMDANVAWAEASTGKENPPPKGVDRSDSFAAGLRCVHLVLEHPATASRPIFLFTVTPRTRIEESTYSALLKKKNVTLHAKSENFKSFAYTILAAARKIDS